MAEKDDISALSEAEKKQVIAFIQEKAPDHKCPTCGKDTFFLADHLVSPPTVSPSGGVNLGGATYPLAMAICTNCFNVTFFAALPMGVRRKSETKRETTKEEQADG